MESPAERLKAANTRFWDRAAERWRALPLPTDGSRIVDSLGCPPGALVLDAGCGAGRWSVAIGRAGYRVWGVDLSPVMIAAAEATARQHGLDAEQAQFRVAEAAATGFPDTSFDAVVCNNVLDFVPSPGATLLEFWRVLKPGGRLLLATLGAASPVKRERWRRYLPSPAGEEIDNGMVPWETERLLGALGWEILEQHPVVGPAASGAENLYSADAVARLPDRVLQQAVATSWLFVARKATSVAPAPG